MESASENTASSLFSCSCPVALPFKETCLVGSCVKLKKVLPLTLVFLTLLQSSSTFIYSSLLWTIINKPRTSHLFSHSGSSIEAFGEHYILDCNYIRQYDSPRYGGRGLQDSNLIVAGPNQYFHCLSYPDCNPKSASL